MELLQQRKIKLAENKKKMRLRKIRYVGLAMLALSCCREEKQKNVYEKPFNAQETSISYKKESLSPESLGRLLISGQYKEADKSLGENIGWLESNENYVELLKNLQERLCSLETCTFDHPAGERAQSCLHSQRRLARVIEQIYKKRKSKHPINWLDTYINPSTTYSPGSHKHSEFCLAKFYYKKKG